MQSINRQILLTSAILASTILIFESFKIDIMVQDYFYSFTDSDWFLDRNDKLTELIFYSGIKKLFYLFVILLMAALVMWRKHVTVQKYKAGMVIVLMSTLLVPLVVGSLKSATNIPCPKNIRHYGGIYPYVTVLKWYPSDFVIKERVKCFPAGHASGGFSLMALFFLFKKKKNKFIALSISSSIGWAAGLYKILIGDHFLSHTLVSMMVAWLIILLIQKMVLLYMPIKTVSHTR